MSKKLKYFNILRTKCSPFQISLAILFGFLLGFNPHYLSIQNAFILVTLIFIRVPIRHFILATLCSYFLGLFALDFIINSIGKSILDSQTSISLLRNLFELPFVPFTRLNNTMTLGASVLSLALYLPVYFLCKKIKVYLNSAEEGHHA